jgi:NADH-quinone oxidoreductase subunit E
MVELLCQHCNYRWDYQGENRFYATCPRCRYKVRIPEETARTVRLGRLRRNVEREAVVEKETARLIGVAAIVKSVVEEYNCDRSMLIQILLRLQKSFGWLPRDMLTEASKQLKVPLSQVYQIATFYKAFSLAPRGRHLLRVCMGTSCKVRGAEQILDQIQRSLKIESGGTTPDGNFSLETVNCVGCCALGPVMTVDGDYHGNLKLQDVERILSRYR